VIPALLRCSPTLISNEAVKPSFPERCHKCCEEGGDETGVDQVLDPNHDPLIGPGPDRKGGFGVRVGGSVKRVEEDLRDIIAVAG
jgi:hypothetical protein